MTSSLGLRCACPGDGGGCGRLAGFWWMFMSALKDCPPNKNNNSQAAARAAGGFEEIASGPALDWRIRDREGIAIDRVTMIDRAFMARLWTSFRAAVQEFKISRMQRKSDSRFKVVEVRKCERRRRYSSSGCRPHLSARCSQLKRSVRRRSGIAASAAAATVSCHKTTTNANAGWGLVIPGGREEETEEEEDESVTDESTPINWTRWKEIEIGEFSHRTKRSEIAAISSSKSMEEFGSLKWEEDFLTSASTRSALLHGDHGASSSAPFFDHCRWENRVSNKTPQLIQPVRGKLTTLSSLLRTLSDRYARRTGKLTPLHDRASKSKQRPVLTQSRSAASWMVHPRPQHHRTNSTSRIVDDASVKRFDNPFQDFLRLSIAERNSISMDDFGCQR